MLLIIEILRLLTGFSVFVPETGVGPVRSGSFEVTKCSPRNRSLLLARIQTDFAPELKDADIDEAYCIDPSGLQSPEFEIALISAGPAIDPGMPRVAGSGGEAAWVLRNAFGSRPLLQPSLVTDWFIEFSGSNSFDAVAVYPDGRTAVVYYRD